MSLPRKPTSNFDSTSFIRGSLSARRRSSSIVLEEKAERVTIEEARKDEIKINLEKILNQAHRAMTDAETTAQADKPWYSPIFDLFAPKTKQKYAKYCLSSSAKSNQPVRASEYRQRDGFLTGSSASINATLTKKFALTKPFDSLDLSHFDGFCEGLLAVLERINQADIDSLAHDEASGTEVARAFRALFAALDTAGFPATRGKSVCFWSGVEGRAKAAADPVALGDGDIPAIDIMIQLGAHLQSLGLKSLAKLIFAGASAEMALQATGEVRIYSSSAADIGNKTVSLLAGNFNDLYELPRLKKGKDQGAITDLHFEISTQRYGIPYWQSIPADASHASQIPTFQRNPALATPMIAVFADTLSSNTLDALLESHHSRAIIIQESSTSERTLHFIERAPEGGSVSCVTLALDDEQFKALQRIPNLSIENGMTVAKDKAKKKQAVTNASLPVGTVAGAANGEAVIPPHCAIATGHADNLLHPIQLEAIQKLDPALLKSMRSNEAQDPDAGEPGKGGKPYYLPVPPASPSSTRTSTRKSSSEFMTTAFSFEVRVADEKEGEVAGEKTYNTRFGSKPSAEKLVPFAQASPINEEEKEKDEKKETPSRKFTR